MQKFEYTLFADYFQFYLQDENAESDLSDSWTPEAVDRFLAVAPGTIGVGTVRNMNVPVVVEVIDRQPDADLSAWDLVNECTLELPSGRVVIADCTDYLPDAARIDLTPGSYRTRRAHSPTHFSTRKGATSGLPKTTLGSTRNFSIVLGWQH